MSDSKTYKPGLKFIGFALLTSSMILAGCSDSSSPTEDDEVTPPVAVTPPAPVVASFDITISNLTNAQPFSPVAVVTHQPAYTLFQIGSPATVGLEVMAEGGDNSDLIDEALSNVYVLSATSGAAPIPPANSETITIEMLETDLVGLVLSAGTMLVNTNDAITGLNQISLENMVVGDVFTMRSIAYDAGTEANTERAIYIPGPAGGGEGFNPTRDDLVSVVTMSAGVVSLDDGLGISDLTDQHRFDNPVAQFRIERTE